jgi:hypothetical protein
VLFELGYAKSILPNEYIIILTDDIDKLFFDVKHDRISSIIIRNNNDKSNKKKSNTEIKKYIENMEKYIIESIKFKSQYTIKRKLLNQYNCFL